MTHTSAATFQHAERARLRNFWRDDLRAYEMEVQTPQPGTVTAQAGPLSLRMDAQAEACRIEITCEDAALLPDYRTWLSGRMQVFDPDLTPLAWSGAAAAGALPPTLAVGEVRTCAPWGTSWWRMTLALSAVGYARFASPEHWHFRLLRAADTARAPVWPRLDDNGVIRWPDGDEKLTDRVFTVRDCDPAHRTITFDIYRHPGGPTSDWAETRPLGQTVGLMGPGAKAGPEAPEPRGHLLVGGDETSAPAILRALEKLPQDTSVHVILLVGTAGDIQPIADVRWLRRDEGATEATLLAAVRESLDRAGTDTRLWFAASKAAARQIRTAALEQAGLPKNQVHSVSFWS